MMKCPKCGQEFAGNFCPRCGIQVKDGVVRAKDIPIYQNIYFWLIIGIAVVVLFLFSLVPSRQTGLGTTPITSDSSDSKELGSRLNPAKITQTVTVNQDSYGFGNGKLEVTLTGVTRGTSAWNKIEKANQYNDKPEDGKEYLIAKFKVKCIENTSEDDSPIEVNYVRFDYADSDYAIDSDTPFVDYDSLIDAKLYKDSSTEGNVIFEIEKNDNGYIIYEDTWFYVGKEE